MLTELCVRPAGLPNQGLRIFFWMQNIGFIVQPFHWPGRVRYPRNVTDARHATNHKTDGTEE